MPVSEIKINSKKIQLMKPISGADYTLKTVLTNSPWEYVELWLKRSDSIKKDEALMYWRQAKNFFIASENLPIESKPLTQYYCCLNASKALLAVRGNRAIDLNGIHHGISSKTSDWLKKSIKEATVFFRDNGVLKELSLYFNETVPSKNKTINVSVYSLLYNIPCVHRSFSITYGAPELFVPISNPFFYRDTKTKEAWLGIDIEGRYSTSTITKNLKNIAECSSEIKNEGYKKFRTVDSFAWNEYINIDSRITDLKMYHNRIRRNFHYIYGDKKLWYIKKNLTNANVLDRGSITLIYATMHWLSELVRYSPQKFTKLMNSNQNWLIQEFIDNALYQFIDEISCEITKADIMTTGHR